jgi:predicted methyltransferase
MYKTPSLVCIATALVTCAQTPSIDVADVPDPTLRAVLAAQPEETRARYVYRHPQETLEFLGVKPGMTAVEALPGSGWYTKILLDFIGAEGQLIRADYAMDMWPLFGSSSEEFIEGKRTWTADWTEEVSAWRRDDSVRVSAFVFGSLPPGLEGRADAVLFIRALHNLSHFEERSDFLTAALAAVDRALRPGGILGVVQHQAPERLPDEWVDGSRGYLKKDDLIATIAAAGFRLRDTSDVNENPRD